MFILNLLYYSGFKNVDILGFDANWLINIKSDNFDKKVKDLLVTLIHNYETFYEIKRHKKKWDKINYQNLSPDSWYNLI